MPRLASTRRGAIPAQTGSDRHIWLPWRQLGEPARHATGATRETTAGSQQRAQRAPSIATSVSLYAAHRSTAELRATLEHKPNIRERDPCCHKSYGPGQRDRDKKHVSMTKSRPAKRRLLLLVMLLSSITPLSSGLPPVSGQVMTSPLVAAVLPSSRSARVGSPVTAFVTVLNPGSAVVRGVGVFLKTPISATLTFQTTDPSTNSPVGTPNTPIDLPPSGRQTFVIVLTPTAPFAPTVVAFDFSMSPG